MALDPSITLSFDPARLDIDRIHRWLSAEYWSPRIRREVTERAIANSLNIGAYAGREQVGFARAVTDRATFGWLCDVIVDPAHRGKGIGRAMAHALMTHPDLRTLRRWSLATRDAHGVYSALGFHGLAMPERHMEFRPPAAAWQAPAL